MSSSGAGSSNKKSAADPHERVADTGGERERQFTIAHGPHLPRAAVSRREHLSLIEPKRALFKISDGRYLVPVGLWTDASGAATLGLASSPDVDEADEEVVWVESHLESSSLHSQRINWVIRDFFGHAFE